MGRVQNTPMIIHIHGDPALQNLRLGRHNFREFFKTIMWIIPHERRLQEKKRKEKYPPTPAPQTHTSKYAPAVGRYDHDSDFGFEKEGSTNASVIG